LLVQIPAADISLLFQNALFSIETEKTWDVLDVLAPPGKIRVEGVKVTVAVPQAVVTATIRMTGLRRKALRMPASSI
jgi:hypothetical protein